MKYDFFSPQFPLPARDNESDAKLHQITRVQVKYHVREVSVFRLPSFQSMELMFNDVRNVRSVAALYLRERQLEHNTWPIPVYVLRSTPPLLNPVYVSPLVRHSYTRT